MGIPHVIVIPYPAQGHVIPLIEVSKSLVKHGAKITFVNTEFNHKRVMAALLKHEEESVIRLVAISDGLELWEDRNDLGRLTEGMTKVMPVKLRELIEEINGSDCDEISCVLADGSMAWALGVAAQMRIPRAAFWPASASLLALSFSMEKLMDDGVIDNDGSPIKDEMVQLSPTMPPMNPSNFVWNCIGNFTTQKIIFNYMINSCKTIKSTTDWIICNSVHNLEPGAFTLDPQIKPIGPLSQTNDQTQLAGYFWQEDSNCLNWLDQQQPGSVIYVAFGSFTVLDHTQFQELALGLESTNRPFLWVVRPDFTNEALEAYPKGFLDRVSTRAKMVGWAPQREVLSHGSIGCFLTHCGWNSTMEGVTNGLPFLCWPYFADQFLNETYICDVWKVGLKFEKDESGIVRQGEIKSKVEELLGNDNFKVRALDLKDEGVGSVGEGGESSKNFKKFIEWMKTETCS